MPAVTGPREMPAPPAWPPAAPSATRPRPRWLDVLAALAAIAALLVLLGGVPAALITVFGLPVPHALPSLSLLTHRLSTAAVIRACSVVAWLAWLQLVWCVAVEVTAAVRNTGMPARVPLAGGTQRLVHHLVTTALLLSAAAALTPALLPHPLVTPAGGRGTAPPPAASGRALGGSALGDSALGGGTGSSEAGGRGPAEEGSGPSAGPGADERAVSGPHPAGDGCPGNRPGAVLAAAPMAVEPVAVPGGDAVRGPALEERTEKIYVVKPPEGRFHESLWEIAERHLGNGRRYREIFELNEGRRQPDGSKLTIASLIRPGWILIMPRDARGPGIEEVRVSRYRAEPGHPEPRLPEGPHPEGPRPEGPRPEGPRPERPHPRQSRPQQTPGPAHSSPARPGYPASPGPAQHPHHPPVPAGPAPASRPGPGAATASPGPPERPGEHPAPGILPRPLPAPAPPPYPYELAAAALAAAGVLSALGERRRQQLWHRAFGRRIAWPGEQAGWAELALRMAADETAAELTDAGLRYLGWALAQAGRPRPVVFAAHIGSDCLDLWVAPASHEAPPPWFAVGDGQVWRLPFAAVPGLPPGPASYAAPYPGLVSIGTDGTGRVLVDVTAAPGLVAVTGPPGLAADVLAAMATELATSRWSAGVQLTLAGFGADLAVLSPGRVRLLPTLAAALPGFEAWTARAAGGSEAPHVLITAVPPAPGPEHDRLLAAARAGHPAGGACLAAGEVGGAAWTWEVTGDRRLRASPLGLDVAACPIPREQQVAVVELFETAADLAGVPLAAPPVVAAPPAPATGTVVEVRLLGPVSVRAPGRIDPGWLAVATELVAYLATHPAGVDPNVLAAALWPGEGGPERIGAALEQVSAWLGQDGIGRPQLAPDATGRLRLGSGVQVDWQAFCTLLARADDVARGRAPARPGPLAGAQPGAGPGSGPGGGNPGAGAGSRPGGAHAARRAGPPPPARGEEALLAEALSLVKGRFLADRSPRGYAWLAVDGLEHEVAARVADAAHRLCELRLARRDWPGAVGAVRSGLLLADDDLLWRDLLTTAYASGDEQQVRAVAGELAARLAGPGLAPATEALLDEVVPAWRWSLG
jgi:hypothetical protein